MAKETAKKMRWHKEENINDGVMRHPSDSIEWKSFDKRYPTFSVELRNIRLGLASNGFQPNRNMSSNYSIWPVVLATYNFTPWDCMKSSYLMMTLLIPGPKCPGWSTKGKLICPCCHKDTHSISLCNKLGYMGHRRFLSMNHPYRRNRVFI
ncbi:hypothetical protein P3S67_015706 [Capsicum chacoense]